MFPPFGKWGISCFRRETRWLCPLFPKQEDQSRGEWSTNKLHPPISLLRLSLPFSDCVCIFLICICVYFLLMFCVFPAVTNGWDFPTQPDMTRPCWLKNWRLCSMYFFILNLNSILLYYVSIFIELNEEESFCLLSSLKLISTWAPCSLLYLSHLPIISSRFLIPVYSI